MISRLCATPANLLVTMISAMLSVSAGACAASCWAEASAPYGHDPLLLMAISWKESHGNALAVGPPLPGGHRALGQMQINTNNLPQLRRVFGYTRKDLFDECTSQKAGAFVLNDCVQRFGRTWKAVGCYYTGPASRNTAAQIEYAKDVERFYKGYRLRAALNGPTYLVMR